MKNDRVLIVQSHAVRHDRCDAFKARLDELVDDKLVPATRFRDLVGSHWAFTKRVPYVEFRSATIPELLKRVAMVVALFDGWETDKEVQRIIEAAEDADVPVKILRLQR